MKNPRHLLKKLWVLLVIGLLLSGCGEVSFQNRPEAALERIKTRGSLVVAVSCYPPFVVFDPAVQQYSGSDILLAQAIAQRLGVSLEIKAVQFTSLIPMVQSGQSDLAIGAIYITEARKAFVDFSQPYRTTGIVLVTRKEWLEKGAFHFTGKVIGVKTGGKSVRAAENLKLSQRNLIVKSYPEVEEALIDLDEGQLDAVLNDQWHQLEYNKTHSGLMIVGDRLTSDSLGVAAAKGNQDLLELVNQVIDEQYRP
jgi:ABC-type amino acid transport substrate-binding protein